MISRCSAESAVRHLRNASLLSFFCTATSGSSDVSSIALAASSSSSTSLLRRSADGALNGVIAKSQVETADRPSNWPAWLDIEKNFADEVFRNLFVPHEP